MRRAVILYAGSWGLLGNANAARGLVRRLGEVVPGTVVDLLPGEDVWPAFAEWGRRISEISALSDPDQVFAAYRDLERVIVAEVGTGADTLKITAPAAALRARLADLRVPVIATKGLLARFALAAGCTRVTNWITNPGLLNLKFHVCPRAHLTCVPRPEDAVWLVRLGVTPSSVRVTGPTIELPFLHVEEPTEPSGRATESLITIYAPTISEKDLFSFFRAVRLVTEAPIVLVTHARDIRDWGTIIANNGIAPKDLRAFPGLSHTQFLDLLNDLRMARDRVLITKSGPNSMFEVIQLGIPLIIYRSGLPMEEWVPEYIVRHGLGVAAHNWNSVADRVAGVIGHVETQARMIEAQARLRQMLFKDPAAPYEALAEAVADGD